MQYSNSVQFDLFFSSPFSTGGISWGGCSGVSSLWLVASVVCGSSLAEGPSVCGSAVCVQLIGASAMGGCGGAENKVCEKVQMCLDWKFNKNTEELKYKRQIEPNIYVYISVYIQ